MKPLHIFRAGRHTASCGTALSFAERDLQASVAAYDPTLHEAPIVIGHPTDNGPAYGWVKALSFSDGDLIAEPHQLNPDFAEMVQAGAFKKVSASFYSPDAPTNPAPGTWYLRHVGFLGAQPPALKGLPPVAFGDSEEGIVEFGDMTAFSAATLARNLREWLLRQVSKEAADEVVPNYLVRDLEMIATAEPIEAPLPLTYAEDHPMTMTPEQIAAAEAELATRSAELERRSAEFAERERLITATEQTLALTEITSRIDGLVAAGKVLPAEKARMVSFMAALDDSSTVEFSEGDQARTESPRAMLFALLDGLPSRVDFAERAPGAHGVIQRDTTLAQRAIAYRTEQAAKGLHITATEAVHAVTGQPA